MLRSHLWTCSLTTVVVIFFTVRTAGTRDGEEL
jgi:hypothetical protein